MCFLLIYFLKSFLESKGIFDLKFYEITLNDGIIILIDTIFVISILNKIKRTRNEKKKYGEVKCVLEEEGRIKKIIILIVLILIDCILLVRLFLSNTSFIDKSIGYYSLVLFLTIIIIDLGYFGLKKPKVTEAGIFCGRLIRWNEFDCYYYDEYKLIFSIKRKTFGMRDDIKILFIVHSHQRYDLDSFLEEKFKNIKRE